MSLVREILFQFLALTTITVGILGTIISILMMFAPRRLEKLGRLLNYDFRLEDKLSWLNYPCQTSGFTFRFHRLCGTVMIAASGFLLAFLIFGFKAPPTPTVLAEVVTSSLMWLAKIVAASGLAIGGFLLLAPERLRKLEEKMNRNIDTQSLVNNLNESHDGFDSMSLRHPVLVGSIVLIASLILIVLSVTRLFRG